VGGGEEKDDREDQEWHGGVSRCVCMCMGGRGNAKVDGRMDDERCV
jgi:hypothetical protein